MFVMSRARTTTSNSTLRNLPSVDELMRSDTGLKIASAAGREHAAEMARTAIAGLRSGLGSSDAELTREALLDSAVRRLGAAWQAERLAGTHRVINATGVVIHTNLGRAPLSEAARRAVSDEASRYCTLEYDLATGKRGRRGRRAEELVVELTGAEDALIVNNCAAAAFFVLTAFSTGGEVVISRGELVEIGGDFRVPDVLAQSGGKLREVGTTNRTRLADYEKAVNKRTRVLLRVHPSNYRIVGFTAMPSLSGLAGLAKKYKVLLYEDLGSGALIDLRSIGLEGEPTVRDSISAGVDVVTFSGDKLLGGPQAGIIAGRRDVIERLRKHPLYRALRVDKLAYAALEATLDAFRRGAAADEVPVLQMLSLSEKEMGRRASAFVKALKAKLPKNSRLRVSAVDGVSAVGGGAAPAVEPRTKLIALSHKRSSAAEMSQFLRRHDPPIIVRIVDDRVMIDLRTMEKPDEEVLVEAILELTKI